MDEVMKKRIVSILLALVLCMMLLPTDIAMAAAQKPTQAATVNQNYSNWTINDLVTANTYRIFPISWYASDMTKPVTKSKLNILIGGLRSKLENTGCVAGIKDETIRLPADPTVKEVMKLFYEIICDYTFTPDLQLEKTNDQEFMKLNGIYTGKNGEQALKAKCSIEQACVLATRLITVVYDKLDAGSKGFFYKTEANGNTVYMLGSIHIANSSLYPLNEDILKAYDASDALAVEINTTKQTGIYELMKLATYTDGTTLKDHVSKDTYDKVIKLAEDNGYQVEMIDQCKAWYLYIVFTSLAMKESTDPTEDTLSTNLGIDMHFLTRASLSGKQILEVEGYGVQAAMLDSFSDGLQEQLLYTTIDAVNEIAEGTGDSSSNDLLDMFNQWHEGDEEEFEKYTTYEYENSGLLADDTDESQAALEKEFKEKLYTNRDKNMADYIDQLLTSEGNKTYFVIVGSGHYVSDYDVIDLLAEKGYTITQIK